ncbi:MAG: DUF447 family protein [Candidatus Lokiarchaeota archaeon]|nr:DUF447 family protein [Candidatus Lokiarchaeota archaeon]MBD3201642.1 DUF447 family protein [Candidatus Lokiarchaeota archaeon]
MKNFGMKKDYLYEILATTINWDCVSRKVIYNTSCMGVRYLKKELISIKPYPETQTYINLKENEFIVLNFVDNIYLYALAALKNTKTPSGSIEFPIEEYSFLERKFQQEIKPQNLGHIPQPISKIPHLKQAWGIIVCKVNKKRYILKKDGLGDVELTEFILEPAYSKTFRSSYHLFNRSENLALEMIIISTRLRLAVESGNKKLLNSFLNRIDDYRMMIHRFGKNEEVEKVLKIVENYCNKFRNL